MPELDDLASAIERTVTGPLWHGPSLAELFKDMTFSDAIEHPIGGAHSIWELTLHIAAWANIARERLSLEPTNEPTPEQDWPRVATRTQPRWWLAVNDITDGHRRLADAVRLFDSAKLNARVPGHDYTVRVMLRGVVEHGSYHGGQIALLTRALQDRRSQ